MAVLIRHHEGIKRVKLGNVEFLVSQYADDTSIILDGSYESLKNCLKVLKLYANASGLYVNMDKTKVIWIGSKKDSKEKFCEDYGLHWGNGEFTVLGVKFTKTLKDIVEVNYDEKLREVKRLFSNWSKRILTPLGKIVVIKSLALAKLNYLILALPSPSKRIINDIKRMVFGYLWNNGPDKIKRNVVVQDYKNGGLKMIDIEMFICSLKLTWLRRILLNRNKYTLMVNENFPFVMECLKYGSKYIDRIRTQTDNIFWKDVIISLNLFLENTTPSCWNELKSIPVWFNPHIKVGGNAVFYGNWKEKGILLINDFLDSNGEVLTLADFQRKFDLQVNFLQFEGMARSIKDYIFSFDFASFLYREDNPIRPYPLLFILRHRKGCRDIYDKFKIKNILPSSVRKWQNELNLPFHFDWKKIFDLPFKITKDTSLRWFQVRIIHRILGTNYTLSKMNLKTNDRCTFCRENAETVRHLFWDCEAVDYFWNGIKLILQDNCGFENIEITVTDIILGNPSFDDLLNELILLGKRYIFRMKTENKEPSLSHFRKIICLHYKIDKYNAVKNQTQKVFERKWNKYRDLVEFI